MKKTLDLRKSRDTVPLVWCTWSEEVRDIRTNLPRPSRTGNLHDPLYLSGDSLSLSFPPLLCSRVSTSSGPTGERRRRSCRKRKPRFENEGSRFPTLLNTGKERTVEDETEITS